MTVTPETNATLAEIASALLKRRLICICGHVNPDGDCIGSTLALACALRAVGREVVTLVAGDVPAPRAFDFMPGFGGLMMASELDAGAPADAFVAVDVPNDERLGDDAVALRDASAFTVTIDHHAYPRRMSDLSYTEPHAAATTLLVWQLAHHLGISDDSPAWRDIATCAYAGLLTDTGRFMFQNTDALALHAAAEMFAAGIDAAGIAQRLFQDRTLASVEIDALAVRHAEFLCEGKAVLSWISLDDMQETGAEKDDTEGAINVIRSIQGVEVACMLKERDDCVRGSLRAKGDLDVASLARELGGGGHKAAAGFTLHCPMDEARATMHDALRRVVS